VIAETIEVDTHVSRLRRMRQAVLTSCRLLTTDAAVQDRGSYSAFITLTLAPGQEWEPGMMGAFIRRVRAWYFRRGVAFRYSWVAELTKKKRMHYHLLAWLPRGLTLPKPDNRGWWPFGSSNIQRARHAGAYISKYLSKGSISSSDYPSGARIYGAGGYSEKSRAEARWWRCPSYVREVASIADCPMRAKGGGFLIRATGELLASPWGVVGIAGGIVRLVRLASIPPPAAA